MKKLLSLATAVFLLLPTVTMTASAISDNTGTGSSTTTTEDKTTTEPTETETETEVSKKARFVREEDNKKKFVKTALTEALKKRIGERCVSAQSTLRSHREAKTKISDKYSQAYDKLVVRLEETSAKLKAEGKDTTALDADITMLKTKVATFKASVSTLQQALKDLGLLNCKTDPTAFKASLEAARADQQAVEIAAKDVHSFLRDTVKPALNALKDKEEE